MLLNVNDHEIRMRIRHFKITDLPQYTTCVFVIDGDGHTGAYASGLARCSLSDRYNRRIGRKLALLRAMQQHPLTRDDKALRTAIWKKFFEKCKR